MAKPTDVGAILKASRERRDREDENSWGSVPQSSWFPEPGRSPDFFPPDVRVMVDQDIPNTDPMLGMQDPMLGPAHQLVHKALLMKERGAMLPVRLAKQIDDNVWVSVLLTGDQKIVRITTQNPFSPTKKSEYTEPTLIAPGKGFIYMLSGVAKTPSQITDVNGNTLLRSFAPTPPTASAYSVPVGYHDNMKLGDAVSTMGTKSSMYSGSMKRIVQAIQGMGKIKDNSPPYIQTTPPQPESRSVALQYSKLWSKSSGLYKAGTKNFWLVEISNTEGILAMPLPLIGSTTGNDYAIHLAKIGDVGGLAVVTEFGGLPSGETFPSGTLLTESITKGKVLRLLTPGQLSFYASSAGETHSVLSSWAFSESGRSARNVRFNYRREHQNDDASFRLHGEEWGIEISLSLHNVRNLPSNPVGYGSASIRMLSSGGFGKQGAASLRFGDGVPFQTYSTLAACGDQFDGMTNLWDNGQTEFPEWGCVVYVYFDGDTEVRVRWHPSVVLFAGAGTPYIHDPYDPDTNPAGYSVVVSEGWIVSKSGFSCSYGVDIRGIDSHSNPTDGASGGGSYSLDVQLANALENYPRGNYAGDGTYDSVQTFMGCVIPDGCRESSAFVKLSYYISGYGYPSWSSTFTTGERALVHATGVGIFGVDCSFPAGLPDTTIWLPAMKAVMHSTRSIINQLHFNLVVNAGPTRALAFTSQLRPPTVTAAPAQFVLVTPSPGVVALENVTFIGSY
jgi:hypothetical protein